MRIADNPNHPNYGPVRRFWVVLAQLGMLHYAETWRDGIAGMTWEEWLDAVLPRHPDESGAQRALLHLMMKDQCR